MLNREESWLLEEKFGGEKSEAFFTACQELKAGVPLAYLIGYIPFLNTKIYLDSQPLIPRPETEFWAEKAIAEIKKNTTTKILDLCAGSGCIGVAIAKNEPSSHIDFIELELKHLKTIQKNCKINNIKSERYRILIGDLFSPLTSEDKYDFILTNPPYINKSLNRTEQSVKDYEPSIALYGGEFGFELIEKIITFAPQYLNSNGQLWIEHEPEQIKYIYNFAQEKFYIHFHKDQYKINRFTQLVLK